MKRLLTIISLVLLSLSLSQAAERALTNRYAGTQNFSVTAVSNSTFQTVWYWGTQPKATIHLQEVVVSDGVQYTIERVTRFVWENNAHLTEGDTYDVSVKDGHMTIHLRKGGNQGRLVHVTYRIQDIRPASDAVAATAEEGGR
jgi:hypothetical protein